MFWLIDCQREALLERESSSFPGNAAHKTELRSQTLLFQTLLARWTENNIQSFLKTVGFHQKYSDIKTPAQVWILKRAELNQAFSPPANHLNFSRRDLQFVMSQIEENNFVVQTSHSL